MEANVQPRKEILSQQSAAQASSQVTVGELCELCVNMDDKNFAVWNVLLVNIQMFLLKYKDKLIETKILLVLYFGHLNP